MHQVFEASGFDLAKTIPILLSMLEQGKAADTLEQVKGIERRVADYLLANL
jgi:hypothetical protein